MTTISSAHFGNKDFQEILPIVTSTKITNLAKQAIRNIANFTMIVKKK